ncbi:MAG: S-layer homology domain-containing protein [Clostridia bacterium]|nr:S-layer homology domain-containing protein [Clostridia bacterium]
MFKPDDNISRAEVAKIINKLLGMNGTTGVCNYIDVSKSHWSYENIVNLSDYGLINGYEDGSFRPDSYITRAEMAQIINELYKYLE